MKNSHYVILVIVVAVTIAIAVYTSKQQQAKENYIDGRCIDIDTQKLLKLYHLDISELSKDIVETGIDVKLVEDPKSYPIIATKLLAAGFIACDNATGTLERTKKR